MSVSSVKTGEVGTSLLVGNAADASDYYAIETIRVGSGGVSSITFSSIPQTYTHLQVRAIMRGSTSGITGLIRINSDTGSNYTRHRLQGNGISPSSGGNANISSVEIFSSIGLPNATSTFATIVVDILDYNNTNKNKTLRVVNAVDNNGSGNIELTSGMWMNTSAITGITVLCDTSSFAQHSHFALYGIKA